MQSYAIKVSIFLGDYVATPTRSQTVPVILQTIADGTGLAGDQVAQLRCSICCGRFQDVAAYGRGASWLHQTAPASVPDVCVRRLHKHASHWHSQGPNGCPPHAGEAPTLGVHDDHFIASYIAVHT